jgi:hypothetical protein|tara:strand:+ start:467 stop:646 length:180 start_codon:yes stop_codon:yes gene_type:complete
LVVQLDRISDFGFEEEEVVEEKNNDISVKNFKRFIKLSQKSPYSNTPQTYRISRPAYPK